MNKYFIIFFIILVLINNFWLIYPSLKNEAAIFKMREYSKESINNNDVVVVDGRIYRGRIAWMFNDKNYLEASYLENFLNLNHNLTSRKTLVNLYFIECVNDECGWGTIKDQPEFNQSMEQIVKIF